MSGIAQQSKAINLGQGFPDFACDPELINAVHQAMLAGHNQYPPMTGASALRQAISDKVFHQYGWRYDIEKEITVTAGATQALLTTILATVHPGDEVIVLEPAYDSYIPSIELAGGTVIRVPLQYDAEALRFYYDWNLLRQAISNKTRLLLINSPNNPTGLCLKSDDLHNLAELLRDTKVLVLSDEVYEHMVFDGGHHQSLAAHDELRQRSFIVSSFGKTYHVTGWKIGYVLAPAELMAEFRKVHQFNVFTANSAMQMGFASYMQDPSHYLALPQLYQTKRDYFREGLKQTGFKLLNSEGSYFQCVDYSNISTLPELEFATWLCQEIGVAAIPLSAFYQESKDQNLVRFCFAKKNETLDLAIQKLQRLNT